MLEEHEVHAIRAAFPMRGDSFTVELVVDDPEYPDVAWVADEIRAYVRLSVFDAGVVRDIKQQVVSLLPARHREQLSAFLAATAAFVRSLRGVRVETWMPMDLFEPAVLECELPSDAWPRVLADPRARMILQRRPESPGLRATIDPAAWSTKAVTNETLERAILENLDDTAPYAVYADWLVEQGDPRGELVTLQLALAAKYDHAMARRAEALLELHAYEWLDDLAWTLAGVADVTWRYGFVDRVVLGEADDRDQEWELGSHDLASDLRVIRRLPSMRLLRSLEIRPRQFWEDDVMPALGALRVPLRSLSIHTAEHAHLGDVEPAYPALAALEELRLESRSFSLGAIELPALRSLELATRGLTRDNLASLRAARWPHLEKLVVWLGDFEIDDCDVTEEDYQWILDGAALPAVTYLGLCGRSNARALIEALAVAPIVKRLAVLDLSSVYFDDADLELLTERRDAFAHLREMHVAAYRASRERLVAIAPNLVGSERFIPVYE